MSAKFWNISSFDVEVAYNFSGLRMGAMEMAWLTFRRKGRGIYTSLWPGLGVDPRQINTWQQADRKRCQTGAAVLLLTLSAPLAALMPTDSYKALLLLMGIFQSQMIASAADVYILHSPSSYLWWLRSQSKASLCLKCDSCFVRSSKLTSTSFLL